MSAEDTANTRDALRRYQASIREGRRKVTYRPSTPQGIGRVFADRGLSLQNFCKRVRHTLAAGKFHDIDTVNAHPVILMALCRQLAPHISISNLEYYVENREELLAELVNNFSCREDATGARPAVTRDHAKDLFLRLLYGGTSSAWLRDAGLADTLSDRLPPFVKALEQEVSAILDYFWVRFPSVQFKDGASNAKASRLSVVLQHFEHMVLMAMAQFFRNQGWTVGVYVFDGLMLERRVHSFANIFRKHDARIRSVTAQ